MIEEEPVPEQSKPADEYQLKVSESEFFFTNESANNQQAPEVDAKNQHASEPTGLNELPAMENIPAAKQVDEYKTDESIEEQLRKTKERILRLKDLSMKLRSTNGLQEIENEPAYRRKQRSLDQVPHSSESQVSRFTLSSEDGVTEIRPNNSFLHDNVD